jgi:hypothetical protein
MRASIRSWTISRICGAVTALWLCGAGAAWAGGGGGDLVSLQNLLQNTDGRSGLCQIFKIVPCPIPPTVSQAALEVAALGNNLFEMLLAQNNIVPKGSRVYAANPAADPPSLPPNPPLPGCGESLPISSTTTPTVQDCLSTLTPLAFISQSPGTATAQPTQLTDASADTFLYAVALSSTGASGAKLPKPDKVYFFYETLFRNNPNGTISAQFKFPLSVLNSDGTERAVPTTLNFAGSSGGGCSAGTVKGDFNGSGSAQTLTGPKQIGVDCTVVFSASPASPQIHAIYEVSVPLLVTTACSTGCLDQLYFYSANNGGAPNPVNSGLTVGTPPATVTANQGVYTAFAQEVGYPAGSSILGTGLKIGLAPSAGSLPPPPTAQFAPALCASLPVNTNGTGAQLRPAVGAFYAVATSGETLLAAPLPSAFTAGGNPPVCP